VPMSSAAYTEFTKEVDAFNIDTSQE